MQNKENFLYKTSPRHFSHLKEDVSILGEKSCDWIQPESRVVLGELERFRSRKTSHKYQVRWSINRGFFKCRYFECRSRSSRRLVLNVPKIALVTEPLLHMKKISCDTSLFLERAMQLSSGDWRERNLWRCALGCGALQVRHTNNIAEPTYSETQGRHFLAHMEETSLALLQASSFVRCKPLPVLCHEGLLNLRLKRWWYQSQWFPENSC